MKERILSLFIDESEDFGAYESHAPFYLVAIVFHDQSVDIGRNVYELDEHLRNLGYQRHAIHTGPLVRRESVYSNDSREERRKLFHALFQFSRKLDLRYACVAVKKAECWDVVELTAKVAGRIAEVLLRHQEYLRDFDRIVVYYDNGQIELTKILTSVFHTLFSHVEFRKVKPVDYKLFQVADLVCTLELVAQKLACGQMSRSEEEFFGSGRALKKNYLKYLRPKKL